MQQILVIAKQTFREAVRNKILLIFVILSLIAICCSIFMPVVGDGSERIKIVESMCLRSITFFGILAAILISASSIPTDIEDKLLWTITTKPISRTNLILGKITGFVYIIGLLLLIMGSASYALIRFAASRQDVQNGKKLLAREKFEPSDFQVTGKSAKNIGDVYWIEGGERGSCKWDFEGLSYKERPDKFEIETKLLVESGNRFTRKIPINIKIINPYSGKAQVESIEVFNNRPASLKLSTKILAGSEKLSLVISPKNPGDFIGMNSDSLKVFLGEKSFAYNFLKGLAIIAAQFVLMIIIATLGSTFLSLPVNILLCLFIFLCGNIIDFMRDLSTVINIFGAHEHDHDHGISAVVNKPNTIAFFLNYILKKPLLALSYILPNFKSFNVGHYFVDSINIPYKKMFASFGYALLYVLLCLPLSFMVFKRREFV
jgi:ABC-type transport system involved in multi-copper enzyme maturation permease subunit